MSKLWSSLEKNNDKSIFQTLYAPEIEVNYDSDASHNDNNSISSSLRTNTLKSSLPNLNEECKYLEPLFPEKIRWFYKESKLWVPFCGYDSLRLETKYRELAHNPELSKESTDEKIVVRGDLFEVDVLKRTGFPIYWNDVNDSQHSFPILRGTWFRETSWQPLDSEDLSNDIETEHLNIYGQKNCLEAVVMDGFAQHLSNKLHLNVKSLVIMGYHIDWYDADNVFMYTDSASHFIRQKLKLTKVGSKLARGYKYEARIDDKLPDITHLVFVIHGIGQKMKGGDITFQTQRIRSIYRKVTKKFFPLLEEANQRVEFLPVEWRKSLILDGDTVELITPNRNKGLRNAVNTTALDILYYSSPIYRPEMIGSLRSELNRLYSMFCARSPYFENKGGKVSALSHSLGTVLLYDILTNWSPAKIYEYLETLDMDHKDKLKHDDRMQLFSELNSAKEKVHHLELLVLTKSEQENAKRGQTNFRTANFPSNFMNGTLWKVLPKLDNLFCVGSPLSVFLALRGLKPQNATTIDHVLPPNLCSRVFNIFHPADPVVYRMEPLINKAYANIEPVRIYRVDHPNKIPYDEIGNDQCNEPDNIAILESVSDRSFQEDLSQKTSEFPSATLAGKFINFFHKFKSQTTTKLTNSMVNQVVSTDDLLDQELELHSLKIGKVKKKDKKKTSQKSKQNSISSSNGKLFNNTNINFSKMGSSFRRSKGPTWKELSSYNHRQSLRRLSEIPNKRNMDSYINSCNSDLNTLFKKKLSPEDSSEDETLKSSDSDSLDNGLENQNENVAKEIVSPEPLESQLKYRIDYKLPESRYESSYLSVLTSHTCYWSSPELCMFMLTHIFGPLGSIGKPL